MFSFAKTALVGLAIILGINSAAMAGGYGYSQSYHKPAYQPAYKPHAPAYKPYAPAYKPHAPAYKPYAPAYKHVPSYKPAYGYGKYYG